MNVFEYYLIPYSSQRSALCLHILLKPFPKFVTSPFYLKSIKNYLVLPVTVTCAEDERMRNMRVQNPESS